MIVLVTVDGNCFSSYFTYFLSGSWISQISVNEANQCRVSRLQQCRICQISCEYPVYILSAIEQQEQWQHSANVPCEIPDLIIAFSSFLFCLDSMIFFPYSFYKTFIITTICECHCFTCALHTLTSQWNVSVVFIHSFSSNGVWMNSFLIGSTIVKEMGQFRTCETIWNRYRFMVILADSVSTGFCCHMKSDQCLPLFVLGSYALHFVAWIGQWFNREECSDIWHGRRRGKF